MTPHEKAFLVWQAQEDPPIIKDEFLPWYKPEKETGIKHQWVLSKGPYYGPLYECVNCGKKSKGWHLWKEDAMPTCKGSYITPLEEIEEFTRSFFGLNNNV